MKDSFNLDFMSCAELPIKNYTVKWRQCLDLEVWILHITGLFLLVVAYFLFVIP